MRIKINANQYNSISYKLRISFALVIVSVCFISQLSVAGLPEQLFESGSKAYLDGEWEKAIDSWQQIESSGYVGGELFYNLGNGYFQVGKLGYAILYWEKAAHLIGEDEDVSHNLEIARKQLRDKLDGEVRLPVWDWFDNFRAGLSTGILSFGLILITVLLFGVLSLHRWVWRSSSRLKWVTSVITIILILNLSLLMLRARDDSSNKFGVFIVSEAEVLSAPAIGTGKMLFTLHEGTKVRLIREVDDWFEIDAGKERQGWIKRITVGVI